MRRTERGFSLLEIMMAMAVLVIAILGTIAAIASDGGVRTMTRETETANRCLMRWVQNLRSLGVGGTSALCAGGADVRVHNPPGAPEPYLEGMPAGAELTTRVLSEAEAQAAFPGTQVSWDLDGDNIPGEDNVGSSRAQYGVLAPVHIRLRWTPESGGPPITVQAQTMIYPSSVNK